MMFAAWRPPSDLPDPPSDSAIPVDLSAARTGISTPEPRVLINGKVFAPGEFDYDSARSVFYGVIGRHLAAIVRAANAADVARTTGLPLAARSDGHSLRLSHRPNDQS